MIQRLHPVQFVVAFARLRACFIAQVATSARPVTRETGAATVACQKGVSVERWLAAPLAAGIRTPGLALPFEASTMSVPLDSSKW